MRCERFVVPGGRFVMSRYTYLTEPRRVRPTGAGRDEHAAWCEHAGCWWRAGGPSAVDRARDHALQTGHATDFSITSFGRYVEFVPPGEMKQSGGRIQAR